MSGLSDDINFRKDSGYRKILEGGGLDVFNYFLNAIRQHDLSEMFFGNLEYFRENDKYGNPDLYSDSEIGKFSPTTLKYVLNILNILEALTRIRLIRLLKLVVDTVVSLLSFRSSLTLTSMSW